MILNATPYDLGLPCVRYISSHWWTEANPIGAGPLGYDDSVFGRIRWSFHTRPLWDGPTTAVLIDREGTDAETLVKVLKAFDELLPTCFRIVYDPYLRVVYPHQAPTVDAVIGNRSVDANEVLVGQLAHAFAADCYLMGVPILNTAVGYEDVWDIDREKTLAELPAQLDLTRAASQAYESITGKPVWPCVHERYHHGKGCGHNIFQTIAVWERYNQIVGDKWPGPRVWWSGSMWRNPGNEADGWIQPSERDLLQYAEVVR